MKGGRDRARLFVPNDVDEGAVPIEQGEPQCRTLSSCSTTMQVRHDPRAIGVDPKPELSKTPRGHGFDHASLLLRARVEHEKPAAARAHQLAADRPGLARRLVVLVDGGVGHLRGELALVGPVLVEQLAVGVDVAGRRGLRLTSWPSSLMRCMRSIVP